MRFAPILSLGLWASYGLATPAGLLMERAACNKDNCYNAVTKASAVNTKDCQTFMTRTVTPCPTATVTSTRTATVTSSVGSAAPKAKRAMQFDARQAAASAATCPTTGTNTAVPTYAAACSGTVRYSSACSCLGVSTGVTTAPSPTATSYKTITTTTTVTAAYSTFKAKATSGLNAGKWLARNVTTGSDVVDRTPVMGFTPDASKAETFVIVNNGSIYGMFTGNPPNPAYIWRSTGGYSSLREDNDNNDVDTVVKCSLAAISLAGDASITCLTRSGARGFWQNCPNLSRNALYLGPDVYPGTEGPGDQCFGLDLVTVPVRS